MWTLESEYYPNGSKNFASEALALEGAVICYILRVPMFRLLKDGQEMMDQEALHRRVLRDNPNLVK